MKNAIANAARHQRSRRLSSIRCSSSASRPIDGLAASIVQVDTAEVNDPIKAVRHGTLIDLIALSPAYPNQWALRLGNATWLGAIEPQFLMPEPVPIWRNPLAWLRNDCRGLVLANLERSGIRRIGRQHFEQRTDATSTLPAGPQQIGAGTRVPI